MTNPFHGETLLQRALLAVGAMLGASALFVGIVMLLLASVVDLALGPAKGSPAVQTDTAEQAQPSADDARHPSAPTADSKKGPGERS